MSTVPAMVSNLKAEGRYFSINVYWREPVPLNGILLNYTIKYTINGTSSTQTTKLTTFMISNLTLNMRVSNISVSATTGGGEGPLSEILNAFTLARPCKYCGLNFMRLKM